MIKELILAACVQVGIECPTIGFGSFETHLTKGRTECKVHEGQRMCRVILDRAWMDRPLLLKEQVKHELCHVKVFMDTGKPGGHKRRWQKCARRAGVKTYYAFK